MELVSHITKREVVTFSVCVSHVDPYLSDAAVAAFVLESFTDHAGEGYKYHTFESISRVDRNGDTGARLDVTMSLEIKDDDWIYKV